MGTAVDFNVAKPQVLEFFAGVGLARLGLEQAGFRVVWANDFEPMKQRMYENEFGFSRDFVGGDIRQVHGSDLPHNTSVAWASSPCTDLSLAGQRAGLSGPQSGVFWEFIRILYELGSKRPKVAVLENVNGLATSHSGDDLAAAIKAFNRLGYSADVLTLDARRFVPQSRSRLFVIGAQNPPPDDPEPNSELRPDWLQWVFGDEDLRTHRAAIPMPPSPLVGGFGAITEQMDALDDRWWDTSRLDRFLSSLSLSQSEHVSSLRYSAGMKYRTAYRRTRNGVAVWEVRHDDIAGCLRTARGGSSKQAVVQLGDGELKVRWMTPIEYARLMGAGDYNVEGLRANQVLFGFGDAVVVPVVAWLSEKYLMPLVRGEFDYQHIVQREVAIG